MKNYLLLRRGRYFYSRRVPDEIRAYDSREHVRVALKTDSLETARQKVAVINAQTELYWQKLIESDERHNGKKYEKVIKLARMIGFSYMPSRELAALPITNVITRLNNVDANYNKPHVEAVLGGVEVPAITIRDALELFWDLAKNQTIHKSPNQLRKWKNPRILAVNNFVSVCGNKVIHELTRDDIVLFRDWWIERIKTDKLGENSANKNLVQLKGIVKTVSRHKKIKIDVNHLFDEVTLKERHKKPRAPFKTEHIIDALLKHENLTFLTHQEKWLLFAMADTGARLTEMCGLLPEDINLGAAIPYIAIVDRITKEVKVSHTAREIPLVGYALDAFKECPQGFPDYFDKADGYSSRVNGLLRENGLLPTDRHSVYSLRHSFYDRLIDVDDMSDKMRAELMGHKYKHPDYGKITHAQKLKWLKKVQLKKA